MSFIKAGMKVTVLTLICVVELAVVFWLAFLWCIWPVLEDHLNHDPWPNLSQAFIIVVIASVVIKYTWSHHELAVLDLKKAKKAEYERRGLVYPKPPAKGPKKEKTTEEKRDENIRKIVAEQLEERGES